MIPNEGSGRRELCEEAELAAPDLILFALRRASAIVMQDFQATLGKDQMRPAAFAVLSLLKRRPGLRQSQLSPALGIRRTNLVPLLADLERRGLSERRPVPGDRRASALYVTSDGEVLLRSCESGCAAHEARLIARLGQDGRAHLLSLLHRLG